MRAIAIFDIDGVLRDVGGSYRRAIADTVEHFTQNHAQDLTPGSYRPTLADIDQLKSEGLWNNDWQASQELIYRQFEQQGKSRTHLNLDYDVLVEFFQSRYRGPDPQTWTGYICSEPLLCKASYFEQLTQAGIAWGFFSGAMRDEALYALTGRLGFADPALIAMEDAPGKPDPTGLFRVVEMLDPQLEVEPESPIPVIYAGDTVADLQTIIQARQQQPDRQWLGVGVLPPHVQTDPTQTTAYYSTLENAGASLVIGNIEELTGAEIENLIACNSSHQ
ncbi:MAG: TIGR01548 family HAD-type hydrolase [Oscillatoriales cyanobacterium SM2_3_0]|nr:TIGR01548 family HAD-type hydrolase [Oscillatoriales cyanobacterium SM2_3_0]